MKIEARILKRCGIYFAAVLSLQSALNISGKIQNAHSGAFL